MSTLRLAIPSTGALYDSTRAFLDRCGLRVNRANERRYTADIPSLPGLDVLFQRQSDITREIDGGAADLGIVGLDRYYESRLENGDTRLVGDGTGFGQSSLVIAVPDSWLDVTTVSDLADLALEYHEKGTDLRIATKYLRLVKRFLNSRGVNYFTLIPSSGGIEAAPIMGYADLIADISATGVTLRENQLRPLVDGTVIESQAVIIANLRLLAGDDQKLDLTREFLERVEASRRARNYVRVSANMVAGSIEQAAKRVMARRELAGIDGPSISRVFSDRPGEWFNVQVVVPGDLLLQTVDHMRELGGASITVNEASFVFRGACEAYDGLLSAIAEHRAGH